VAYASSLRLIGVDPRDRFVVRRYRAALADRFDR
jgi:hypothetical protein